jgi:DNA-binding HxlR family transcriptional regulator
LTASITLSNELRRLVEARIGQTVRVIEETLNQIKETQEITLNELTADLKSLEASFNILSQKWCLEILYTLFLKNRMRFNEIKGVLGINSRTLSDKLKALHKHGHIERNVEDGPPLRVEYTLATRGKNTVLLALPLLYYSRST